MTQEDVHFIDKSAESEVGSPVGSAVSVPTLSEPGLLVMDVDSTLIDEEVIDELGVVAGCGEARVALLEGLPISVFDTVHDKLHFTKGALELIDTLHEHGWKIGVVSGGFHEVVDMLAAEGHIDYWIANRLEVADGCLTGKVLGEIVSKTVKLHALQTWADRLGIPMSQTVAVGDGANDIPMIQAAGLGLAFCAKPKTQLAADKAINDRDLTHVLDYLRR